MRWAPLAAALAVAACEAAPPADPLRGYTGLVFPVGSDGPCRAPGPRPRPEALP